MASHLFLFSLCIHTFFDSFVRLIQMLRISLCCQFFFAFSLMYVLLKYFAVLIIVWKWDRGPSFGFHSTDYFRMQQYNSTEKWRNWVLFGSIHIFPLINFIALYSPNLLKFLLRTILFAFALYIVHTKMVQIVWVKHHTQRVISRLFLRQRWIS